MTTTIVTCICYSPFQDKTYGGWRRIANIMKDITKAKCTVCAKIHSISAKIVLDAAEGSKEKTKTKSRGE
jgi:hypothetical protein